eukprot:gene41342-55923_t
MTDFVAVTGRAPLRLTAPLAEDHKVVGGYRAATGLVEAIDVAMLLGVPLLLTGEPGTGKTRAAYWLAHELGGPAPLRFDVKSGSTGRDLLYTFDEVARFRDASSGRETRPLISYLRFSALGEAILRAAGGKAVLTDMGETAATPDTRLLLNERVAVEEDAKVKAALQAALKAIDGQLAWGERLGAAFSGISLGSILLLVALGLAITYGLMGVINMAHGELMMIGAYATYVVQGIFQKYFPGAFDWYLVAALPLAFGASAAVGAVLERGVLRFLYG